MANPTQRPPRETPVEGDRAQEVPADFLRSLFGEDEEADDNNQQQGGQQAPAEVSLQKQRTWG